MSAFPIRYDLTAEKMSAGIDDYLERMNAHTANAEQLRTQATKHDPETQSAMTCWESPQQLRLWAHENELAQECMKAMYECGAIRTRSMLRAFAHRCYCLARKVTGIVSELVARSLAEIVALFADHVALGSAPPMRLSAPPVLATCHASNAPSLSPIAMNHWQAVTRE